MALLIRKAASGEGASAKVMRKNDVGTAALDCPPGKARPGLRLPTTPSGFRYVTMLTIVTQEIAMKSAPSTVISMRLPAASGKRLNRMANRHGWPPSDASARLVEEGLRRSEFAFIDFRDSSAGRQACLQGSTLAVWEVMLLVHSYQKDVSAVARHLKWPEAKVQAAVNYAGAFPEEINEALAENETTDFTALKNMIPQAGEFVPARTARKRNAQASPR